MLRLRLALTASLAVLVGSSVLMGQDTKSSSDDTPTTAKVKGALPAYFSKLGLTDDQLQKVRKVHMSFKGKIEALNDQLKDLRNQERVELNKILNDTQRTRLRELRSREPDDTSTKEESKKVETKKEEKK